MQHMKTSSMKLSPLKKSEILLKIIERKETGELIEKMSAMELQDLRNFLENELQFVSSIKSGAPLSKEDIALKYLPISNYYHLQHCYEPMDACFSETCLSSNAECFSRKMRGQIKDLLEMLQEYFFPETFEGETGNTH
ncbi:MAG: hypothetical protein ACE5GL_05115 [Calditrichia bacterium]